METFLLLTMVAWSALVAAIIALLYRYATAPYLEFANMGIGGPKPLPFVGNMLDLFRQSPAYTDMANARAYGKVYGVFSGRRPVLMVGDVDMVREITLTSFQNFSEHTRFRSLWQKPLSSMMSVLTGNHWRHVRSSISPTFTTGRLKQMTGRIGDCAQALLRHLHRSDPSVPVDASVVMSAVTLDVIAATAFGLDAQSLENPNGQFQSHALQLFSRKTNLKRVLAVAVTYISQWLTQLLSKFGVTVFDPVALEYLEAVVKDAIEKSDCGPEDRKNFAQLCKSHLVDITKVDKSSIKIDDNGHVWTNEGLTIGDVTANAVAFLLAGHDTTSTFLACFCYAMATNPDVQEKLYDDIALTIRSNPGGALKPRDSTYLDWCVSEALRMYPPALRMDRRCTKTTAVGSVNIREGMTVNIPIYAIHHDPDYWPEPLSFKPERFSPEQTSRRHSCAYLPFGSGPRNCLGMRFALIVAKTLIASLLLKYKISACESTPKPPLTLGVGISFLTPAAPLMVKLTPREADDSA